MKHLILKTFSSLKIRNYRVYYLGQIISLSGTYLQALAQDWLVLKLTNSGTMLGLVLFFQFMPMLILTFYGGVLADSFQKIRLLYLTQVLSALLALTLGILVLTNTIQLWMVFAFALCLGTINSLDNPARSTFLFEIVGKEHIANAVSLWAVLVSSTRIIGPAIAGILINYVGIGQCFIINAISYVAVILALFMIKKEHLHVSEPAPYTKGQIRQGLNYVKSNPVILNTLIIIAIIGTITFEWQASVPLFAKFILNGNAATYAELTVAMGVGMLVGGLMNASQDKVSQKRVIVCAFLFGVAVLFTSFVSTLQLALAAFFFIGITCLFFGNLALSLLQIESDPKMRGRVMSFFSIGFMGSTAIGGPLIGWIGQQFGAQWSFAVGGIAAIIASIIGWILLKSQKIEKPTTKQDKILLVKKQLIISEDIIAIEQKQSLHFFNNK